MARMRFGRSVQSVHRKEMSRQGKNGRTEKTSRRRKNIAATNTDHMIGIGMGGAVIGVAIGGGPVGAFIGGIIGALIGSGFGSRK